MKYVSFLLLPFFFCTVLEANAQKSETEKLIRSLEKAQCDAIVNRNTVALYKIWADDFTVNSPTNDIVKLEKAKEAIRKGLINYSLCESTLEELMVFKDMVVTMGSEVIKPREGAPMAGQTVMRRYTHIWLKRDGSWKLLARHANIIK